MCITELRSIHGGDKIDLYPLLCVVGLFILTPTFVCVIHQLALDELLIQKQHKCKELRSGLKLYQSNLRI